MCHNIQKEAARKIYMNIRSVASIDSDLKEPTVHGITITAHFTLKEMLTDKESIIEEMSKVVTRDIRNYVEVVDSNLVRT